jgi:hypothetical protein
MSLWETDGWIHVGWIAGSSPPIDHSGATGTAAAADGRETRSPDGPDHSGTTWRDEF